MATSIYMDESGFTGYNLLDPRQPMFAVASTDLDDETSAEILNASFPNYQGAEYKFSSIWRSRRRRELPLFAVNTHELHDRLFVYYVDKRFAVLTKLVDYLIEPHVTDAGYDFYADGFCWKYSNYIYFGLTHFAPDTLLDALLASYQRFSRSPSRGALRALQAHLRIMATSTEEPLRVFFEQMEFGARLFERYHSIDSFGGSNEL